MDLEVVYNMTFPRALRLSRKSIANGLLDGYVPCFDIRHNVGGAMHLSEMTWSRFEALQCVLY
jgi:hypothetical protein